MPSDTGASAENHSVGDTNDSGDFYSKAARVQENIQELKSLLKNLRGRLNVAAAGLQQVASGRIDRGNFATDHDLQASSNADGVISNGGAFADRSGLNTDDDAGRATPVTSNSNANNQSGSSPLSGDDAQKSWNFVAEVRWPSTEPHSVGVVGSFNDWNKDAPIMLKKQNDGFATAFEVPGPGKYFYKFVVDGQWVHDAQKPAEPDTFGGYNNVLDVESR